MIANPLPSSFPFLSSLSGAALPLPGRADRVAALTERWLERAALLDPALGETSAALAASDPGSALITAIFGNSPYLAESWIAEAAMIPVLLAEGPDATLAQALRPINDITALTCPTAEVMTILRRAKRQAALIVAVADITGHWSLERVTEALSILAGHAIDLAATHYLGQQLQMRGLPVDELSGPDVRRGLVILGMGKLGARELNYSSDIDLIVLFDPDRVDPRIAGLRDTVLETYIRLAKELVRMLQERTGDGYVFRTDLRLRPDPASTPPAMSVLAAETYYETVGQNWERAAMIKARPVAGDIDAGNAFLRYLRPFVWRKHLDFAAINDIHSIKRQIHAFKGGGRIAVLDHNIKIGRGGIREIEFFAQTQQLIWGGRDPGLRVSGTCEALDALVRAGRVKPQVAADLKRAYRFLRQVEHRIQMVEDQQTHKLPPDQEGLERIARFAGFGNAAGFEAALVATLATVRDHNAGLFEEAPSLSGPGNLVFTGTEDDPETVATLESLGFRDGAMVSAAVRGWHHGRMRATRSARARELLTELMPTLLTALARTSDPDGAFARFDRFLQALPAGVQIFSLLYQNPHLVDQVAEVMGAAPALADYLSRHPRLLDGVLSDPEILALPGPSDLDADLREELAQTSGVEEVLDAVRRWAGDRRFQAGLTMLRGKVTMEQATRHLSDIADTVIGGLLQPVSSAFAAVHGQVPGGRFAVIGAGKLGARELSPTSDLDLIFVYDFPPEIDQSDGAKPLPPSLYYQRLGQRLISALTALTAEGELYQVDMRLRPTGNKGPVACTLDSFAAYQRDEAWTWEHMALTRARAVAGDPGLMAAVEAVRRDILCRPRDAEKLLADIADMRRRVAKERPGHDEFDLKDRRGGLLDCEFLAQYLVLRHAATHPQILTGHTPEAFEQLVATRLLDPETGATLARAARLWLAVQGMLRLLSAGKFQPDHAPDGMTRALVRAAQPVIGAVDFAQLRENISATAAAVQAIYTDLIDTPAARHSPPNPEDTGS